MSEVRGTAAVIEQFNHAFVHHLPDELDELVGEECVLEGIQPAPDGDRHEGRQACLAFWRSLAADRGTRFAPEEVVVAGEHATIRWRYHFGDGPADSVRGVNLMRVRDGRIVEAFGYGKTAGEVPLATPDAAVDAGWDGRSYHVDSGAGIDGLTLRRHRVAAPGPGQVLVAVRAAALSYRDLMVLRGDYVLPVKPDVVPVADGAGEVVAVGAGVRLVRIGDRVAATVFPHWQDGPFEVGQLAQLGGSLDGMLTELALLDERALVPVPAHLSFAEAATLPCAAVAAWNALTGDGGAGLRPGETVVTLGTGGVSLFALQLAKALGARVIATTSGPEKARRLVELGADEVVDYRADPDWPSVVRELTGGRGADRVVDVVGDLAQSLAAVKACGQVAFVGLLSGRTPALDPGRLFASGATVRALAVGSRAQFAAMNRVIEEHRIRPVVDRVVPFDRAPEAFRHYASGAAFGKVVIETAQPVRRV